MSKKNTVKKGVAAFLSVALLVGGTGCTFLQTDSEKDYKQTVATVNISKSLKEDKELSKHADSVGKLVEDGYFDAEIYKSELYSAFMSTGYTYVNSYGYTYKDTFNLLMDSLVSRKIIVQYAVAYYLENGEGLSVEGCEAYVNEKLTDVSEDLKSVMKQVYAVQYFLTENDKEYDDYNYAVYQLKSSINSTLDSSEQTTINSDEEHNHSDARTKPTNAATEKEEYYPKTEDGALNYDIYTGRNTLDSCGEYEKVDGSTVTTRRIAYNALLSNLQSSNLIKKGENTNNFTSLSYYNEQLAYTLAQALIGKYGDDLTENSVENVQASYIEEKYNEIKAAQELAYADDNSAFETALGNVSDDSFVLYGKKGFGFVYNILLPFSASQEQQYSAAKNKGLSQDGLFNARRNILKGVEGKDLRDSWFDVHEHATSAYEATEGYFDNGSDKGDKTYLFFKDNGEDGKYEKLTQYAGQYPFNGTVKLVDDKYEFTTNKLDIDGFVAEMESYITSVSGAEAKGSVIAKYNEVKEFSKDGAVDYSNFMYYEGKVALDDVSAKNFFNRESSQYKALSAVNELMFAYSTDTGCLNTYMGYVVSPYKTNFVPEFEYAAQYAVEKGVGSYVVCATDYGWHIIYTSFVYTVDGDVYGGYIDAEKEIEGTFSNLFYESLKTTLASDYMTNKQNSILNTCNNDDCVKLFKSTYKDLLELDKQAQ